MATTSLWRIHKGVKEVILYAENPDKTIADEKVVVEGNDGNGKEPIGAALEYIMRENATAGHQWISGINCSPDTAVQEMMELKKKDGRTGGVTAYHGYQSFKEGEVTADQAHAIGVELATRLWGDRFQVVVATHVDKESHIHNHFVINTVPMDRGPKFHRTKEDYLKMQELSDRLCREHNLSVVRHPEGKKKDYSEWSSEKNGKPTYRSMVRRDIDASIRTSLTEKEFWKALEEKGYEFKLYGASGKKLERPSLKPKGAERFFRFDRLGDEYSIDEIRERILENIRRTEPFPEEEQEKVRAFRQEHPPKTKHTGLAALYYHYCYELHIIVHYPASAKQVSFFMREDLRKLERLDEQARFLGAENIVTISDLDAYRSGAEEKIRLLEWERQVQRNLLKKEVREGDVKGEMEVKQKISGISGEIGKLRKNMKICDDVEKRSAQVAQELTAIREGRERGEEKDELFRGRSGTGRPDVIKRR